MTNLIHTNKENSFDKKLVPENKILLKKDEDDDSSPRKINDKDLSVEQVKNRDSLVKVEEKIPDNNKPKLYEPTDREVYAYDIGLFLDVNSNGYILKDDIPTITYNDIVVFSAAMFNSKSKKFYANKDMNKKIDKEIIDLVDFMKQIDKIESLDIDTLIKIRFDIYKRRFNSCFMKDKLINILLSMRFKNAKTIIIKVINKKLEASGRDYVEAVLSLIFSALEISNVVSDIILLQAIFYLDQKGLNFQFTILFIIRLFAAISQYLISYSSGIQLVITKGCYEPSQYKKYSKVNQFFLMLNFTFVSPLFFVFLTVFDWWLKITTSLITFFVFKNAHFYFLAGKIEGLIHKLGLYDNEYEGILEQNAIAKLLFQNSFILIFDTLILTGDIKAPGLIEGNLKALIISYISTIINIFKMIFILSTQSKFFREELLAYSFVTMKAKFNWTPFVNNIKNGSAADKIIDYYLIRCPLPIITQMTGISQNFTFQFNELAINKMREEIACLNINRLPDDPLLRIGIGRCIHKISLPIIGHLISVLVNDNIDIDFFGAEWDRCIDLSFSKKIIKWDKNEEQSWKALTPVRESIISLVIRTEKDDKFELESLLIALINKGADLNLIDTRNFTPLTLATKYRKIRSLEHLLNGKARPNEVDPRADEYPLDIAIENAFGDKKDEPPEKDLKIIELLLKHGADPLKKIDYNGEKKTLFHKVLKMIIGIESKKFRVKFPILKQFVDFGYKTQTEAENITLLEAIAYTRAYHGIEYYNILEQAKPKDIKLYELVDDSGNTFFHLFLRYLNEATTFEDFQNFYPKEEFNYKELLTKFNYNKETPISHCLSYAVDLMLLFEFDQNVDNGNQIVKYLRDYDEIFAQNLTSYIADFLMIEDESPLIYLEDIFFDEAEDNHTVEAINKKIKKRLLRMSSLQNGGKAIDLDESLDRGMKHKKRPPEKVKKFDYLMRKAVESNPALKNNKLVLKKLEVRYNIIIDFNELHKHIIIEDINKPDQNSDNNNKMTSINLGKNQMLITLNNTKKLPAEITSLLTSKIEYSPFQKAEYMPIQSQKRCQIKMMTVDMDHLANLILQIISFADFITDVLILKDLSFYGNRGWTSIGYLSMLMAYLASYTSLISFFIARKSFYLEKKSKNDPYILVKKESQITKLHSTTTIHRDEENISKNDDNNNEQASLRSINIVNNSMLLDPNLIITKIKLPAFEDPNSNPEFTNKIQISETIQTKQRSSALQNFFSNLIKIIYSVVFLSPLCIVYFFFIDIFYLVIEITLFSLRLVISLLGFGAYADIIDPHLIPKIYNKIFKLNYMDVKGLRKLRTMSQLIFETIPMLMLQIAVLNFKTPNEDRYEIEFNLLVVSIIFASLHFLLEVGLLYSESKALLTNLNYYIIICLNGRLDWVPHTEKIINDTINNQDVSQNCILSMENSKTTNADYNKDIEQNITTNRIISSPTQLLTKRIEFSEKYLDKKPKIHVFNYSGLAYSCLRKIDLEYQFYQSTINILGNCFTNMPLAKNKSELPIINLGNACSPVPIGNILTLLKLGYGKVEINANWDQVIENSFPSPPPSQPLDADGEYILISLTQTECIDGLRPFLEKIKHLDCNIRSIKCDKFPAIIAIENKSYNILNLLLRYNINILQSNAKNKNILMNALDNPDESNFCLLTNLLSHPKVALSYRRKLQALDTIKLLYSQGRKAEAFLLIDLLGGIYTQINGESLMNLMDVNFDDFSLPEGVILFFKDKILTDNNKNKESSKENASKQEYFKFSRSISNHSMDTFNLQILENFRGLRYMLPGLLSLTYDNQPYNKVKDNVFLNSDKFKQLYNLIDNNELPLNLDEDEFDLEYLDNIVEYVGLDNKAFFDYFYLTGIFRKELEIKVNISNNQCKQVLSNKLTDVPYSQYDDLFEKLCEINIPNEALALKNIEFVCELALDQSDYHCFNLFIQTQYDCFFEKIYSFTSRENKLDIKYDGKNQLLDIFQIPMNGAKINLFLTHTDNTKLLKLNGCIIFTFYIKNKFDWNK